MYDTDVTDRLADSILSPSFRNQIEASDERRVGRDFQSWGRRKRDRSSSDRPNELSAYVKSSPFPLRFLFFFFFEQAATKVAEEKQSGGYFSEKQKAEQH